MIAPTFTETIPPRAEIRLRCDQLHCDTEFLPRDAYWNRDTLRSAAAREAAWTQDEVGRDHCGAHRSVYASQRMQAAADATYPELAGDVDTTRPDLHAVTDEDEQAAARVTAAFDAAEQDAQAAREYREAGALRLTSHRGRHKARTSLLAQIGVIARKPVDAIRPEPFVLDGDIDVTENDADAWLAPLQQGGTRADRKLRAEFERRGGWLGKPRKPKSRRKRHQKAVAEDGNTMELAA